MIPSWTMTGVLPPIRPGQAGHSPDRSPYAATLREVIERFSTSKERIKILSGYLNYREALHANGINNGFQWLDGSFFEEIETLESRPPKDIDVVTYFYVPSGETQTTLVNKNPTLFDQKHLSTTYNVDGYYQVLGTILQAHQVKSISYWYSMWSHRRNGTWKGFLQVDLDQNQDADARQALQQIATGGTTP